MNVFEGILKSDLFLPIVGGTIVVQVLLVQFTGLIFGVTGLNITEHLLSILFGFGSMPVCQLIRFIDADMFKALGDHGLTEKEKDRAEFKLMKTISRTAIGTPHPQ